MSCKSLLVIGALMFATLRVTAATPCLAVPERITPPAVAAPLPAVPEVCPPKVSAACEVPPAQPAYTMTIYNGPRAVQKTWVAENGSWRSYRAFPDCPRPCGTYAPACAVKAPCAPRPCGTYAPPCAAPAPCVRAHCS
jgi:hypothetical protein